LPFLFGDGEKFLLDSESNQLFFIGQIIFELFFKFSSQLLHLQVSRFQERQLGSHLFQQFVFCPALTLEKLLLLLMLFKLALMQGRKCLNAELFFFFQFLQIGFVHHLESLHFCLGTKTLVFQVLHLLSKGPDAFDNSFRRTLLGDVERLFDEVKLLLGNFELMRVGGFGVPFGLSYEHVLFDLLLQFGLPLFDLPFLFLDLLVEISLLNR
jgi:hypothetical protein